MHYVLLSCEVNNQSLQGGGFVDKERGGNATHALHKDYTDAKHIDGNDRDDGLIFTTVETPKLLLHPHKKSKQAVFKRAMSAL